MKTWLDVVEVIEEKKKMRVRRPGGCAGTKTLRKTCVRYSSKWLLDNWCPRAILRHNYLLPSFMLAARLSVAFRLACRQTSGSITPGIRLFAAVPSYLLAPNVCFIHTSIPKLQSSRSSLGLKTCPSCSKPLFSIIPACTNCWSIFSLPPGITHHELFGLPYEPNPFTIDLSALKKRFRQAQAVCHPDAWTSKDPVDL